MDVLIGDFMSEGNMAALAARKAQGVSAYEFVFVDAITPALADIAKYGIKVGCFVCLFYSNLPFGRL
jgi:hypothetical protein